MEFAKGEFGSSLAEGGRNPKPGAGFNFMLRLDENRINIIKIF